MNTLIIGSSGKIGNFFLKSKKKNFYFTYFKKKIPNGIRFDLMNDSIIPIIDKYKIRKVVFLSAITDPDTCQKNKKYSNNINVRKTKKIINKLIKKKIYILFISSEFVFSGRKGNYSESEKVEPVNLYGKQKIKIENFLFKNSENFSILRIAKTYSDNLNDNTLVTNYVKNILKKKKIFYASKKQIFSPLYVKDLIKIIYFFLLKNKTGLYHVAGPKAYSRYQILIKILNEINKNKKFKFKPDIIDIELDKLNLIAKRPLNVSLNISKLKKNINFKLKNIDYVLKKVVKKHNVKKSKRR